MSTVKINELPTIDALIGPHNTDPGDFVPTPVSWDGSEIIFHLPNGDDFSVDHQDLQEILDQQDYKWLE